MPAPAAGWSDAVCWPCGGAAEPGCTFTAELIADPRRTSDAMGLPVKKRRGVLHVNVPVPRCRDCRARSRGDAATVVAGLVAGAAILAGGYWWAWRQGLLPVALPAADGEGVLWGLAIGGALAGAIVSFFSRMGAVRRRLRESGGTLRPYDDFPPIAALRTRGWDWPSSE